MTALEKTTKLVNQWLEKAYGLPITLSMTKLGLMIAEAIDEAEQKAYERGYQDATNQIQVKER